MCASVPGPLHKQPAITVVSHQSASWAVKAIDPKPVQYQSHGRERDAIMSSHHSPQNGRRRLITPARFMIYLLIPRSESMPDLPNAFSSFEYSRYL
jgi:hypothetical protein